MILLPSKKLSKDIIFFASAFTVIALDQITKFLVSIMYTGNPWSIIGNFLKISLTHNTGMSFGMFKGRYQFAICAALIVIGVILYYYDEINERANLIAAALIIGGAIGNLIDRIVYGAVIDFIDFGFWPSFNLADTALVIGVMLLVYGLLRKDRII